MSDTLYKKMHQQLIEKDIFDQVQQYIYSYMDSVDSRRVYPDNESIEGLQVFDSELPMETGNAAEILKLLDQQGSPATLAQTGGRYFGFVNGGVLPVSLAARMLSDTWDQNTALSVMSPIASKLEEVCERWMAELLNLPESTAAGFVSGSSLSIFCGLAAARYRIFQNLNWDINRQGFYGAPKVRIIMGEQAHATVQKAVALLGFGIENIEFVPSDDQGRIEIEKIPQLDRNCILVLQAGHVCTGAFDSFAEIVDIAIASGAWVHIDGAFGLWAASAPDLSYLTEGFQRANSFSMDCHKTLNTPYSNGVILCSDREALTHALHASGSYIISEGNREGMFLTPEMSRRARVVELWASLKFLGKNGVAELVGGLHQRARQLSIGLQQNGFDVMNDVVFNQVMVGFETDEMVAEVIHYIQHKGDCWLGGAKWKGRDVIRVSVCSWRTTDKDIDTLVSNFVEARLHCKAR